MSITPHVLVREPAEAPRRSAGSDSLLQPVGRASEVGAGIALVVFAIPLLLISLLVVARGWRTRPGRARVARGRAILLALGVALLLLSVG